MKKSIVTFLICAISVFCTVGLSACSESCVSSCASWIFRPTIPSVQTARENLNKNWEFTLPENITIINYALEFGRDGSEEYYVFKYDGSDEEFNSLLSSEKNEEFEKKFPDENHVIKNYFVKEYTFPDFSQSYMWLWKTKQPANSNNDYYLLVLYILSENQLNIYEYCIG